MLQTPVLFLIFNRPDTTAKVFEAIRSAKPKQLFIAADGPRGGKESDREKCRQAREVINKIDWHCEVKTLLRETNLGCKYAVSSAINWFFEQVEEGIILEDDTLPNQSFFEFCEELLSYYRHNMQIMHIGGVNFQAGRERGDASYYFSIYNHVWGWATWKRAWKSYDISLASLNSFLDENRIEQITHSSSQKQYWLNVFSDVKEGRVDTWDYQWTYTIWNEGGISIVPNINLVSNIGFGMESTHTNDKESAHANITSGSLNKLTHPSRIIINIEADSFTFNNFLSPPITYINQVRNLAYKNFPKSLLLLLRRFRRILFVD